MGYINKLDFIKLYSLLWQFLNTVQPFNPKVWASISVPLNLQISKTLWQKAYAKKTPEKKKNEESEGCWFKCVTLLAPRFSICHGI